MAGYNTTQNRKITRRATISALALVALALSGSAAAEQLYVNESGWWRDGGAFNASETPISAAVGAAGGGDSIFVWNGSYSENVNVNKERLTLIGEGDDAVTVTAADSGDHVFEVTANWVNISGFTVAGAIGHLEAGIRLYNVDRCNIYDNNASDNWCGIYLMDSSNNTLQNNAANSNTHYGIYLSSSSNNTLTSNTANLNNYYGLHLWGSNSNILQDGTANSNNYYGIYMSSSSNNTLSSNTANLNDEGGICMYESSNNTLISNTANSNRVGIYMEDSSNNTLQSNTANSNDRPGTHLYYSSDNILQNNIVSNNYWGVYLEYSGNNTLQSNIISNNYYGVHMRSSSGNILTSNTVNSNNYYNIDMSWSNNNTLQSNTASNSKHGIVLDDSSGNILQNNTVNSNNWCGIGLGESSDNIITCNWVQNNIQRGFYLRSGSSNNVSYNNIVENGVLQGDGSCRWQFDLDQYQPVEAKHNYWGAGMNNDTIDASIYDDEEGQGEVVFYPFETEPVQCPLTPEPPEFTTTDAVIALQIAVGSRPPDLRWDVSGDGSATSLDALMILQAVAGMAAQTVTDAGEDQYVSQGTLVTLDGSNSTGTNLMYEWSEWSTVLSDQISFSHEFSVGTHTITLKVIGDEGTDTDNVTVRVNHPPIADAGDDRVVSPNTYTKLDASGSTDPDGNITSYVWKGGEETLSTRKSFNKVFDIGKHEITLTVTDDFGDQDSDTVEVVVNRAPQADAGPDQTVSEGASVHFDGSNSSDPDGDSLSYLWKEDGGNILNLSPSFDMVLPCGTHCIMLQVTDVYGAVSADYVVIDVVPAD